uniref:Uncharacterized protein n=1 Tax=uncultured Acidobacteriota bacterium TaxID=171953 RepID=Q7X2U1_9BACT|nr:hypothetical protein [uncultured Acidobacteriota bacterium]
MAESFAATKHMSFPIAPYRRSQAMSLPTKFNDVIQALESAGDELTHYLDKRTGEIVMITNEEMEAAEEDELISEFPEWQRDTILKAREILKSENFLALPDQLDIHEYKIMEDFCLAFENRRVGEDLHRLIKGSGAFRRFKNAIYSMGADEAWHQFRQKEIEKIAIEWLEEQQIPYTREDSTETEERAM